MNPGGEPVSGRLLGRRLTPYGGAELLLLLLVALQCARLFWIMLAPLGPVGDWRATGAAPAQADASVLATFDPFFRLDGQPGQAVVTSLNLKLYGVREDRASGRGSAIIALADGSQLSFAVGDQIMPGVTLTAVGFDNVTISHNGSAEQIFLDQSPAAPSAAATTSQPQAAPSAPVGAIPAPAPDPGQALTMTPRTMNGRVTGLTVAPGGDGGRAFALAGFQPGDVIVTINGQRVGSLEAARAAMAQGNQVNVMVDRGGRAVPLTLRFGR
jgi:general secretion pathway protein C